MRGALVACRLQLRNSLHATPFTLTLKKGRGDERRLRLPAMLTSLRRERPARDWQLADLEFTNHLASVSSRQAIQNIGVDVFGHEPHRTIGQAKLNSAHMVAAKRVDPT